MAAHSLVNTETRGRGAGGPDLGLTPA